MIRGLACQRCGNIEYSIAPNAIGPIFVDGQEIVRRIFVTVRDGNWNEVGVESPKLTPDQTDGGCIQLGGYHSSADIGFSWLGRLCFDPRGQVICFEFAGDVLRAGNVCRLGLVVLLPPERVAGGSGAISHGNRRLPVTFAQGLGSQPIVNGLPTGLTEPFDRIEVTGADGGTLQLAFEGESFEIEDQRNWGDASFKIYCTPLARGFPRSVRRGDRVAHKVRIRYKLAASRSCNELKAVETRPFPAIGVAASALSGAARDILWSFVSGRSVDIAAARVPESCKVELLVSSAEVRNGGRSLEISHNWLPRVRRVLLAGDDAGLPSAEDLTTLRRIMGDPALSIFAATRGWFVELNRGVNLPEGCDGFAWPVTPTVHSSDAATMFENGAPFTPMVAHLRAQGAPARFAIADLCLGRGASSEVMPAMPRDVLTWLIAALIDAAAAGIECATLADDLVRLLAGDDSAILELKLLIALSDVPVTPVATGVEHVSAILFAGESPGALLANCSRAAAIVTLPQPSSRGVSGLAVELPPRSFAVLTESEGLRSYASQECAA